MNTTVSPQEKDRCILCDGEYTKDHPRTCPEWPKEAR